ncbi:hypothetical protein IOK49_02560 [Fervidicoccus fontis]|uniref:Uncharacterized protein n=1 Tax=Fervidicoccus fontis TaxID=683846 RepID=A0A843AAV4_9CREN|nr:hypothetical protein [Fervidicoccus fontis]MBE9390962.1 hypothetical protein [Fervidicoccus fontis]
MIVEILWKKIVKKMNKFKTLAILIVPLVGLIAIASVFVYDPVQINVKPTNPSIKFQAPPPSYPMSLQRTSRSAICYTDFEQMPSGWSNIGGNWSISPNEGYKGNALYGKDNDGGIGHASQYYWQTSISNYNSLWVSVKVKLATTNPDVYKGIALIDSNKPQLYEISIYNGELYIWGYSNKLGWNQFSYSSISNYNVNNWYILVVNYVYASSSISISAYVYDTSGALVASTSATINGRYLFQPSYVGLEIDDVTNNLSGSGVYFDDFIISTTDPRYVNFLNVPQGYKIEVWDNLGNLINSTISTGNNVQLYILSDIVVGTGSGGSIIIGSNAGKYTLNYTVPSTDSILGGDTYTLTSGVLSFSFGANKTSINVSAAISGNTYNITGFILLSIINTDSSSYYVILFLNNMTGNMGSLNANIALYNSTYTSSNYIQISNGAILSNSTGWVSIPPNGYVNATFSGFFTQSSQQATLYLQLEYCTMPNNQGACVFYPVQITVNS